MSSDKEYGQTAAAQTLELGKNGVSIASPSVGVTPYTVTLPAVAPVASGQVLSSIDTAGTLAWSSSGTGDVTGPASSTDNAITRFDGTTGKVIQNSAVTLDDDGSIAGVDSLGVNTVNAGNVITGNTGLLIKSTDPAYGLALIPNEALTQGRDLNLIVNDANRTLNLSGNLTVSSAATVSGTNTGDQNLFKTIAVSGQSDVVADTTTDTLTFVNGDGITITTNATTDSITITAAALWGP